MLFFFLPYSLFALSATKTKAQKETRVKCGTPAETNAKEVKVDKSSFCAKQGTITYIFERAPVVVYICRAYVIWWRVG